MTHSLPASPNWYCPKILDVIDGNVVAFGARSDLNIFQLEVQLGSDDITSSSISLQKLENNGTKSFQKFLDDAGTPKQSDTNEHRPRYRDCKKQADCVLVTTLSRLHKDRITVVCLSKFSKELFVENNERHSACDWKYSLFTGADDGKIKLHYLSWTGCAFEKSPIVKSKLHAEHQLPKNCKVSCAEICEERLVIGDDKGNLTSWDWKTGLTNQTKLGSAGVISMDYESIDKLLAVGTKNGGIFIYSDTTHQVVMRLKGHDEDIQSLQWRPAAFQGDSPGKLVSGSKDRTLRLWDLSARRWVALGKLPGSQGGYSKGRQDRDRVWLTLAWLPTGQIISTSISGELLVWTLTPNFSQWLPLVINGHKGHNRPVFTITLLGGGNKMISSSMDRNMNVWDISASPVENPYKATTTELSEIEAEDHVIDDDDGMWRRSEKPANTQSEIKRTCSGDIILSVATFGGYAYCVRASPVDPGRLAIGVGDSLIRLWNVNEGAGPYDITNLWQGLKSKVTAVAWHPYNEGHLAYGTEDGRVGVFPALSKKSPLIFGTYHQKIVYVIVWGPPPLSHDVVSPQSMTVYSVGDGTVLVHSLTKASSEPAKDINVILAEANGPSLPTRIRSELAWSHDYSILYLGNEDGSVMAVRRSDFKCICTIKVFNKLINCIRLQARQPSAGACSLMAIGSNENLVKIVDASAVNSSLTGAAGETTPVINEAVMTLKGHKSRVTDMCWSPFDSSKLLTVSYDGKAIVWDTSIGTALSEYKHQHGHILTCQWSLLEEDIVYTGSDDFSLHSWQPSLYKKEVKVANGHPVSKSESQTSTAAEPTSAGTQAILNGEEINQLIEQKKQELLNMESDATTQSTKQDDVSNGTAEVITPPAAKKFTTKLKKKMAKTLFPNMAAAVKRGDDIDDLIYVQQQMDGGNPITADTSKAHLGIYSMSNTDDFNTFITQEKTTLYAEGHIESASYISLWQGDVEESLSRAVEGNSLTDCLVNSASMLGYREWTKYCRLYAQQLRADGLIHKAVSYLLFTHDVDTAILWLTESNLYREAICIVRSRDPTNKERIQELYAGWARQLRRDANYETAAKCFVALGDPQSALDLLKKRSDVENTLKTIRFAMTSPQCSDELMNVCDKLTRECILSGDFHVVEELCTPHPILHPYLAWSIVSQSLSSVLDSGPSPDLTQLGIVEYLRQRLSRCNIQLESCRKQCSLSQQWISIPQAKVAISERILNIAVDMVEGKECSDRDLVDLYTMIALLRQAPLEPASALVSAQLIHLLMVPGYDVIGKLTDCNLKDTRFISDYAVYICYLWSALTINTMSVSSNTPTPTNALHNGTRATESLNNQSSQPVELESKTPLTLTNGHLESSSPTTPHPHSTSLSDAGMKTVPPSTEPVASATSPTSATAATSPTSATAATSPAGATAATSPAGTTGVDTGRTLPIAVKDNMYELTFSLCHGLFLPWLDGETMSNFADHLSAIQSVTSGDSEQTIPSIDLMDMVSFVDKKKPNERLDSKVVKCVLAMLLDMLRHLYIYMCTHDDSSHLPNLPPGRQIIEDWVALHKVCQGASVGLDNDVEETTSTDNVDSVKPKVCSNSDLTVLQDQSSPQTNLQGHTGSEPVGTK